MARNKDTNKSAKERNAPSIEEHLQTLWEYVSYPAKIVKGCMTINYKGEWISKEQFDKLVKRPVTPDFRADHNNIDKTKSWMFK